MINRSIPKMGKFTLILGKGNKFPGKWLSASMNKNISAFKK